jgi:hypothetical protein
MACAVNAIIAKMSAARFFFFAYQLRGFKTIHLRHLYVHQDNVEGQPAARARLLVEIRD